MNYEKMRIDKIFHVADIHILLQKKHDEYKIIFERLYKKIEELKTDNSVIVVAGDILHSKVQLSPESVHLASLFLTSLSNICPTIVLLGNHDMVKSVSRMDALSPIIDNLNSDRILYFKESGLYPFENVIFNVMSLLDNKENYILGKDIQTTKKKIALYHGVVEGATTDTGYSFVDPEMTLNIFSGHDIVLLGDIHKRQVLKKSNPTVLYPGSLICQNYGESHINHGFCVWDVDKLTYKFYDVENEYAYYTMLIKDEQTQPNISQIPDKARVRILVNEGISAEYVDKVIFGIKTQYSNLSEVIVNYDNNKASFVSVIEENFGNVHNLSKVEVQNKFIEEYCEQMPSINTTVDELLKINAECNSKIKTKDFLRTDIRWKPKRFEFDNLFCYGENNVIDFENMKGIYGIFNPNSSGKSSLIDALSYCVFDTTYRASKANDVLNVNKSVFSCGLDIDINNQIYHIQRNGNKSKESVSVKVDFHSVGEDGKKIDLRGDKRSDTNNKIKEYIGTYDEFILTALSLQKNDDLFINMRQAERKDLLAKFMNIGIFDELLKIGKERFKELSTLLKDFNKAEVEAKISELNELKKVYQIDHDTAVEKKTEIEKQIEALEEWLQKTIAKLINVESGVRNSDEIEADIKTIQSIIKSLNDNIITIKHEIESVNSLIDYNNTAIQADKYTNIEEKMQVYEELKQELDKQKNELKIYRVKHETNLDKLKKLSVLEYDPNCKYCMNNVFVKDAIATKKIVENEIMEMAKKNEAIMELENNLNKILDIPSIFNEFNRINKDTNILSKQLLEGKNKLLSAENKIADNKNKLTNLETELEKFNRNQENILHNQKVNAEINSIKANKQLLMPDLKSIDSKIKDLYNKVTNADIEINHKADLIVKYEQMEIEYNAYKVYTTIMERDGLPYSIMKKMMPFIEYEANKILSQITDFKLKIEMIDKDINLYIQYPNKGDKCWLLELGGGMEKFISSIVLRIALTEVSSLSKPNFLIIDEGWGSLDSENINQVPILFQYLKSVYDFVIVISHIETMKDMVDGLITINSDGAYSSVNFEGDR